MAKNKFLNGVLIFSLIALIVGNIVLLSLVIPRNRDADDIFLSNGLSVVELKASTEGVGESFGTAEFVSGKGILITNAHVITYIKLGETYTFENFFIRFMDSEDYLQVDLEKYDLNLDLAVLSYTDNDHKFTSCQLGDSSKVKSGEQVFAIGNGLNYGLTISHGIVGIPIVNIKYGDIERNVIQCDLTISDGNSGGALFDGKGKLIGITTFRTKDKMGNIVYGIAYCIPINIVLNYLK